MKPLKRSRGFTLIEIVIVLAIAGLIVGLVFIALTNAQQSRRDTARKADAAALANALEQYYSNTQSYPGSGNTNPVGTSYWDRTDPSGNAYSFTPTVTSAPAPGTIGYDTGQVCASGGVGAGSGSGNSHNYVVVVGLEQGGSACYDNAH